MSLLPVTAPAEAPTPTIPEVDADLLAALAEVPAANLGDAMGRFNVLDSRIQAIWPGARLAGRARTVWTRAGDNLFVHQAIERAEPGDVLVVNGFADESRALIGELIGVKAKARGIAGFVLDGAARDAADLAALGMPVFARALTPAGPYKDGPGVLDTTIAVGGVAVTPGDIIVGDSDGVVVVPLSEAAGVLDGARALQEREAVKRAANRQVPAGDPR
ncbi:methyltransferase [Actinoalloteichus sp. AHMU CJ021]|uniref:RraA family protein n=1 Tax=Actinoalloteichus TaxID=65496 RepID=UPI0006912F9B|nr:methyltransferase [Actinoalloteichus caeruleus]AUS77343.1 methyltransferase [Actinoalloteichus sp. AHMU CJ021]